MLLFEHTLVIILPEGAKEFCGAVQRSRIEAGKTLPQLGNRLKIDKQRTANHPMLPHQVFGRRDFRLFLVALCRR